MFLLFLALFSQLCGGGKYERGKVGLYVIFQEPSSA